MFLILLNSLSVSVANNLSPYHARLWRPLPWPNAKPMGTMITCHSLARNPTAIKACLSNTLFTALPYGTTFVYVSALSPEKSSKNIHTYFQIYWHRTWLEPIFDLLLDFVCLFVFEFRSFRSIGTIAGLGGVIGLLPRPNKGGRTTEKRRPKGQE